MKVLFFVLLVATSACRCYNAYSAEDVQIQVYGDAAIVAFRMVATPVEGSETQEYLNTGTFMKRDGKWQVVAWQATIIPATIIPAQ